MRFWQNYGNAGRIKKRYCGRRWVLKMGSSVGSSTGRVALFARSTQKPRWLARVSIPGFPGAYVAWPSLHTSRTAAKRPSSARTAVSVDALPSARGGATSIQSSICFSAAVRTFGAGAGGAGIGTGSALVSSGAAGGRYGALGVRASQATSASAALPATSARWMWLCLIG